MKLLEQLEKSTLEIVKSIFDVELEKVDISLTRKDQEGDYTIMVFPMLRHIKGNPAVIGKQIGDRLRAESELVSDIEVVKGFLNLTLTYKAFLQDFNSILLDANYGTTPVNNDIPGMMVEYSSPNTNKPLHLGHIRNIVLGYSTALILEATGKHVVKTQIINDRGIHICKSMLAWLKFGNGATPQSEGVKGDKLVGDYYVKFDL